MPVRTSAAVASGLGLLTLIGVGTIFGDSIVALVAPPPIEGASIAVKADTKVDSNSDKKTVGPASNADPKTGPTPTAETPTPGPAKANRAAGDVGSRSSPDGSS